MPRGRPSLSNKKDFHMHKGYERYHSVHQVHSDTTLHKSLEQDNIVPSSTLYTAKEQFEDYSDIHKILTDIENGIVTTEIIKELSASIDILIKAGASGTQAPGKTKKVGVTDAPSRMGPQTGRSLPKRQTYWTAPEGFRKVGDGKEDVEEDLIDWKEQEVTEEEEIEEEDEEQEDDNGKEGDEGDDENKGEGYEGPPVSRRMNRAKEGNPGQDRGDYHIGDNDLQKREVNSIGIP